MINKVILVGNVGQDPEIRTLETGTKVARVTLATTERLYNSKTQETKEHTEWHSITLWRGLAETADRFVKKGSRLYVEGRIRSRSWTDDTGAKRYAIDIQADEMKLLDRRPEGAPAQAPASQGYAQSQEPKPQAQVATPAMDTPDDLPF